MPPVFPEVHDPIIRAHRVDTGHPKDRIRLTRQEVDAPIDRTDLGIQLKQKKKEEIAR